MAITIYLQKVNNGFSYLSDDDRETAKPINLNDTVKAVITSCNNRTLKHLRRYWGGLLEFTLQYWEPENGMMTDAEEYLIRRFANWLDENGGGGEVAHWAETFLSDVAQLRSKKAIPIPKDKRQLHDWILEKLGYYDVVITPSGMRKSLKSISFESMTEEDFRAFYHRAFGLCWTYIFSKHFETQDEVQNAIGNMQSLEG